MRKWTRKSALTLAAVSAAAVSVLGAGTASAATLEPQQLSQQQPRQYEPQIPATPASGATPRHQMPFDSLQECQTYGNVWAQRGALHTYTCTPKAGGGYLFDWS